ncbi:MAG TPA: lytic transglycosylase domain-containing protein [Thermoanaerobaculia bacterium]|nr:lytic transglycosylase domain-containing protein [Thermoanaerobaculia bacterium]
MRIACVGLAVLFVASTVSADVRLAVKADGSKVIYNIPRRDYRGVDLSWFARRHDRRSKFDPIIERYAEQYGVDPVLVRAVIQVESDFDPRVVSNKGARGLMQLIPATAKRFGVKSIHDPEQNIHGGVRYLSILQRMFNNDLPRVLAAYNAGENAVLRYGGIPPYEETSLYVRRALTVYYGKPYGADRHGITFAARRNGTKLRGGLVQPVAMALIPGAKYLGSQ